MEFRIGAISAQCPKCGSTEFEPHTQDSGPRALYFCSGCGHASGYALLMMQISDRATPRSGSGAT